MLKGCRMLMAEVQGMLLVKLLWKVCCVLMAEIQGKVVLQSARYLDQSTRQMHARYVALCTNSSLDLLTKLKSEGLKIFGVFQTPDK